MIEQTEEEIGWYKLKKNEHIEFQARERAIYAQNRKAAQKPKVECDTVSIIIDNMDQKKTALPHFIRDTHATQGMSQLKMHLTGVLMHGLPNRAYAFLWPDKFPKGADIVIHVLMHALRDKAQEGPLPKKLCLQLDNCGGENKNKYVMAFAQLLVEREVFEEVNVNFLLPGHTHEDVDQMFSCFSKRFARNNIFTVSDMMKHIRSAYDPEPQVNLIDKIADYRHWLTPHIAHKACADLQFTKHRAFRMRRLPGQSGREAVRTWVKPSMQVRKG